LKDPDDLEVQTLSRSSSPSELLFGPLQIAAIMVWLGLYKFMTEQAAITAAAVGIGDGLAPMIGAIYGRHMYQMPFASPKTMEGSVVGVFLGTVAGCYLYLYMMGLSLLPLRMVLTFSGIAAFVEGTAPGNLDNLTVPIAIHFAQSASVVAFLSGGGENALQIYEEL
jgi:dolichol kinase